MAKFRTRARTIDMLGRQQIAGIPTAISELFKNAHDAYADNVVVDYYRSDGLFVLRDDGIGMTHLLSDEFSGRWLTIGTESKLKDRSEIFLTAPPGKVERPMMGEKGIGRLAIGVVGSQVLVLTRSFKTPDEVTAAFINWRLFEYPGIDLDQIEVPVRVFQGSGLPRFDDVRVLVDKVKDNVSQLKSYLGETDIASICNELDSFDINPAEINAYLDGPTLKLSQSGTQFFVKPTNDIIQSDIAGDEREKTAPQLVKMLIGFTNTMIPGAKRVTINTGFRDHKTDLQYDDLIAPKEFFTPEDFAMADHIVRGRFDETGTFQGEVFIYGEKIEKHVIPFQNGAEETKCGPFGFDLAYIQGAAKDSSLPPEDYGKISDKLDRVGGIYIYRNGIRVLPYGNSDYDFLDIERRRSLQASYYFFSYRRMFGVVSLDDEHNFRLHEKAGREGFQENLAYRQLRDILKNFFIQLAADFFRETSPSEVWRRGREEERRRDAVRKRRSEETKKKQTGFRNALSGFFVAVDKDEPSTRVRALLSDLEKKLTRPEGGLFGDLESERLLWLEKDTRRELYELRERYIVQEPVGAGLTRDLRRDWDAYGEAFEALDKNVFGPAAASISDKVSAVAKREKVTIDSGKRIRNIVVERLGEYRTALNSSKEEARRAMDDASMSFKLQQDKILAPANQAIGALQELVADVGSDGLTEENVEAARERLDNEVAEVVERTKREIREMTEQVVTLARSLSDDGASTLEETAAVEEELLALQEQVDSNLELAQLGMAVEIISHEFASAIRAIRKDLKDLKVWADTNPALKNLYADLRTNFDHVDGYLTLLTPLDRRLRRKAIDIRGANISKFIRELFEERLKTDDTSLEATEAFRKHIIHGYPSTFYPVFINLVDNSLFWLSSVNGERKITLDAEANALLVKDTGPGIPKRDHSAIFERGFTRKPGGRGIGLYISKSVLNSVGYDLTVTSESGGAVFRIEPKEISE